MEKRNFSSKPLVNQLVKTDKINREQKMCRLEHKNSSKIDV
jgi:hypothetical protein